MFRKVRAHEVIRQALKRRKFSQGVSLHGILTLPFILQVMTIVSLVGYLSYQNAQHSIEDVTTQMMDAVSKRVEQKVNSYLETARIANQMNSDSVRRGALDLDLDHPNPQVEQFLWQQMQLFRNLTWISLGTEAGNTMGAWRPREDQGVQISISNRSTQHYGTYYATNERGKLTDLLKIERPAYDPRPRPWYKAAIAAKRAVWTPIYAGFTPGTIFIASSQPLYDQNGSLVGVSGIDISLLEIQRFLVQTPVSRSGQIFLIERSGLLVASSSQEQSFRLVSGKSPQRVNVLDSQTPLIRVTAQSLLQQVRDFKTIQQPQNFYFKSNRQGEFVKALPFSMGRGIDWLIIIVVPETDVMAQIHAGTQTTLLLCLAALIAVILFNTLMSRWLVKPIKDLSQASQKIARGDFNHQVQAPNIRELSTLANSFTQMSQELQQSRQKLEDYSQSLEQKVSDRTQSLEQEIQRRAVAEIALQSANQELQQLAYLDGLTQIANRRQFDECMAQEWRRLKRDQRPLSLILCDVDYFKQYNDAYGHQAGDDCLRRVATAIAANARRPPDLAARYGGEEFAMLLPNTSLEGALEVARQIQTHIQSLQLPHQHSKVSQYVTASFGVTSIVPTETITPENLLLRVDQALYQAKTLGRDRIATLQ
jgi:diguanylate cyclase (GGDEF)-like protein